MNPTPEQLNRAEQKAAAVVTHVEITTDIAIWDQIPGLAHRAVVPTPAKNGNLVTEPPTTARNDETSVEERLTAAAEQKKKG